MSTSNSLYRLALRLGLSALFVSMALITLVGFALFGCRCNDGNVYPAESKKAPFEDSSQGRGELEPG